MNKIFIITFATVTVLFSLTLHAQENNLDKKHFNREAFIAKKNAFITAEIGLTPEEAEQFIPLCNELQQKKFELGRECRRLSREICRKEKPTDAEYTEVIDCSMRIRMEEAKLEKEYVEKFKKILSPGKLFKYQQAESKFVREFMKGPKERKRE